MNIPTTITKSLTWNGETKFKSEVIHLSSHLIPSLRGTRYSWPQTTILWENPFMKEPSESMSTSNHLNQCSNLENIGILSTTCLVHSSPEDPFYPGPNFTKTVTCWFNQPYWLIPYLTIQLKNWHNSKFRSQNFWVWAKMELWEISEILKIGWCQFWQNCRKPVILRLGLFHLNIYRGAGRK